MNNIHIEFGSDIDTKSNLNYICDNPNNKWLNNSYFFRSARDILKYIAKLQKNNSSNRVFIPILCCNSMFKPFKDNGYEIIFYPLQLNYTIDANYINCNLKNNDIILVSNYLGLKNNFSTSQENHFLDDLKKKFPCITIIKDYTHNLKDALCTNKNLDDFSIFSVRKWAGFPDGGILWSNKKINVDYDNYDSTYFEYKKRAMDLKSIYLENHNTEIKKEFLNLLKKAEHLLETDNNIIKMSEYSKQLLYKFDFEKILQVRTENIKYISDNTTFVKNLLNNNIGGGLYFPIYLTKNQKEIQKYLAKHSIYCPIIWPAPIGYENFSEFSTNIISHMLAIPCDQRYSYEDLNYIINILKNYNFTNNI